MKNPPRTIFRLLNLSACLALWSMCATVNAVDRYVSLQGNQTPPFTDWASAATNIQDAIDLATDGDVIYVTNGVYASGGKVMAGDLTNRVALDNAVLVKSVNGASETIIQGQWDAVSTNGPGAVRCAWLKSGAVLHGFNLRGGATRSAGDSRILQSGGAAWCESNDAVVANCIIIGNSACSDGGGSYQGTLNNCILEGNSAYWGGGSSGGTLNNCTLTDNTSYFLGGGSYDSTLNNCSLRANSAIKGGGGSYRGTLNNCTVTDNSADSGGGSSLGTLNNCIVWGNMSRFDSNPNHASGTLRYTCSSPLASGPGNIDTNPQLLADRVHIAGTSPCRTNGNPLYIGGTDIDGQAWADPPSMGCDQWQPQSIITLPFRWQLAVGASQFTILKVVVAGQEPFTCWWTKDGLAIENGPRFGGAHTSELLVRGLGPEDVGAYQVVVSNAFGMVTSAVARAMVHCVDAAATASLAPYTNWATAAATIQAAIEAAAPGAVVLVTNGMYARGGKVMDRILTNRVALDKAVLVRSVNGAPETVIQGQWDAVNTNGPGAVRCAWLMSGAVLSGFTLRGGATHSQDFTGSLGGGGGVWCGSADAVVANCIITANSAYDGGGSHTGTINNCILTANSAVRNGGGSYSGTLNGCLLTANSALIYGGGAYGGTLNNCTLTDNGSRSGGGGSYQGTFNNCILWGNVNFSGANYLFSTLHYTCASPLASGPGNIDTDPQFLGDGIHITATSPCRTNGNGLYTSGTDIDGQMWANPPSMGCDQWQPQPAISLLPRCLAAAGVVQAVVLKAIVAGQEPFDCWWTKDGLAIEDGLRFGGAHTPEVLVREFGLEDAGAYQVVASNAFGMATSAVARVVVHCVNAAATSSLAPYTNWATAATTIQEAIEAAAPGAVILVTNGLYASGGKVMAGDLTNRVVLDKAVTVMSVNGAPETVIQGQWDAGSTNGAGAVRCAWLTNGAVLSGFTLRGGATRLEGDYDLLQSGGGVWCASTNAVVANCIITANSAGQYGGSSYGGTLNNCALMANSAFFGGGSYGGTLNNCTVTTNSAYYGGGSCFGALNNCYLTRNSASRGGGSHSGMLNNCTLTANSASRGGGSDGDSLNNCIVWSNAGSLGSNYYSSTLRYSCTSPRIGPGYVDTDPQFLADGIHLAATSPCRGAGSELYTSGTDIDGEAWKNPPSMGCDEVWDVALSVVITAPQTEVVVNHTLVLTGLTTGRIERLEWSFGDGPVVTNIGYQSSHVWTNPADYTVTLTAFNADYPAGVSTNLLIHVVPLELPVLVAGGMSSNSYLLTFSTQAGVDYVVEYVTNLAPPALWQALPGQTSPGGVIEIQDRNATNAARFYRVRLP